MFSALILVSALSVTAPAKEVVCVFDIEVSGVRLSKGQRKGLNEYLHGKVAQMPGFSVVPRAEVRKRLAESKRESYRECYDEACQIELGKELAAQKTVSTKILRLGDECTVSVLLYDLRSAASAGAADASGGCKVGALVRSLESAVLRVSRGDAAPVARRGEVDTKRCPLPGTRRVGEPKGRYFCADDKNDRHGPAVEHFANGQVSHRAQWRRGKLHGKLERFHQNGRIHERGQYEKGKKVGTWTRWGKNGVKIEQGPYADGVKHGDWTRYDGARGYRTDVKRYERDLAHGPAATYDERGQVRSKGRYKDGGKTGLWKYFKGGKLASDQEYRNDQREGIRRGYDEQGRVKWLETYAGDAKSGVAKRWSVRRADDKHYLQYRRVYENGEKHGVEEWFRVDGTLKSRTEYVHGVRSGKYVAFAQSKDGSTWKKVEGSYDKDKKHGVWREYSAEDRLKERVTYRMGKRHGPFEKRTRDGKRYREGTYVNDRRHGEVIGFDAHEKPHTKYVYVDGRQTESIKLWRDDGKSKRAKTNRKGSKTRTLGALGRPTAGGAGGLGTRGIGAGGDGLGFGSLGGTGLSPDQERVRAARSDFDACFQKAEKKKQKTSGLLKVSVKVRPSGKVERARREGGSLRSKSLRKCLMRVTKSMRFGAGEGRTLEITVMRDGTIF